MHENTTQVALVVIVQASRSLKRSLQRKLGGRWGKQARMRSGPKTRKKTGQATLSRRLKRLNAKLKISNVKPKSLSSRLIKKPSSSSSKVVNSMVVAAIRALTRTPFGTK